MSGMRVNNHPILHPQDGRFITICLDGQPLPAVEGEPIAAAIYAAGYRVLRRTRRRGDPRGIFCALGHCTDCTMEVDGVSNVRTCITPAAPGMQIRTPEREGAQ